MIEQTPVTETHINQYQYDAILEKVRAAAPYDGQPIDTLGCYPVHYELPEVDVSIYIPIAVDLASDDEPLDTAIRVAVRHEEGIDDEVGVFYTKIYSLDLSTNTGGYSESVKVRNLLTGKIINPVVIDGIEDVKKQYDLDTMYTSNVFTSQRYTELMGILQEVKSELRFD